MAKECGRLDIHDSHMHRDNDGVVHTCIGGMGVVTVADLATKLGTDHEAIIAFANLPSRAEYVSLSQAQDIERAWKLTDEHGIYHDPDSL